MKTNKEEAPIDYLAAAVEYEAWLRIWVEEMKKEREKEESS